MEGAGDWDPIRDGAVSSVASRPRHPSPAISNTASSEFMCGKDLINVRSLLPVVCERRTSQRVVAPTKKRSIIQVLSVVARTKPGLKK